MNDSYQTTGDITPLGHQPDEAGAELASGRAGDWGLGIGDHVSHRQLDAPTLFSRRTAPSYGVPSPEGRGTEPAPDSIRG